MKKIVSLLLMISLICAMLPSLAAGPADGTYVGIGNGYHGQVPVSVVLEDGKIKDVTVGENLETPGVADLILIEQSRRIVEGQSWNTDCVTGATFTANAVRQAVRAALKEAGADDDMFSSIPEIEKYDSEYTADVIVVGAGLAGMTAAIEASRAGCEVILLEKLGRVGGSSVLSGGNFYATGSPVNGAYENDPEEMIRYYMARSEGLADETLITYYAENSGENVKWLIDNLGTDYGDSTNAVGFSSAKRQHLSRTRGAGVTVPAYELCLKQGVKVLLETPATDLLTDETGAVCGVVAEDAHGTVTVHGKSVVLATGGFTRSPELMEKYSPIGKSSIPTAGCGNTGDGLIMAMSLGADTIFRNVVGGIQVVNEWMYMEDGINNLVWYPTLFVNAAGYRFVDESQWYTKVYDEMAALDSSAYYWIFDGSVVPELCEEAVAAGYGVKADTVEELAVKLNMDETALRTTYTQYNTAAETNNDELFGRRDFAPLSENGPYYGIRVKMATCHSIGGLITNVDTEVLRDGQPIPGLYAAGEIADGQFFGKNYSSDGSMIGIATVFGRQAGIQAAEFAVK